MTAKESAIPIDFPLIWGSSIYTPTVISDGSKLLLVSNFYSIAQNYDKSTLKVFGDENALSNGVNVIIEFLGWVDFKSGKIGEDFIGHPDYIPSLRSYKTYEVINSGWLRNLKQIMTPTGPSFSKSRHFVLGFHDTRFECIANGYYIRAYPLAENVFEIAYNLISH